MKRKFLAKAITLGLMLAVPLGVQAAQSLDSDKTDTPEANKTFVAVWNENTSVIGNQHNYTISGGGLRLVNEGYVKGINQLTVGGDLENISGDGKSAVEAVNIIVQGGLSNSATITCASTLKIANDVKNMNKTAKIAADNITVTNGALSNKGIISCTGDLQTQKQIENASVNSSITAKNITVKDDGLVNEGTITCTNDLIVKKNLRNKAGNINANNITIESGNLSNQGNIICTNDLQSKQFITNGETARIEVKNITVKDDGFTNRGTIVCNSTMNIYGHLGNLGTITANKLVSEAYMSNGSNNYDSNVSMNINNIEVPAIINNGYLEADTITTTKNISNNDGIMKVKDTLEVGGDLKNRKGSLETVNLVISQNENASGDSFSQADLKVTGKMTLNENANFVFEKGQDGSNVKSEIANLETSGNNKLTIEKDVTGVRVGTLEGNNAVIEVKSDEANKIFIGKNNSTGLTIQGTSEMTDSYGDNISGGLNKLKDTVGIAEGSKEATLKLAKGSVVGDVTAQTNANGDVIGYTEAPHEENAGISEMASIGLMAWRAENNDMNKRLGELRSSKGEHGVWTRMVRGQSKYGAQGIKNQYSTYQLGYDEKLSVDKHWTVGAAVSYTDASSSFTTGHGENKHTGLAVYGSYLGDNGSFVDLIAKVARLKNEFDVMGGAGKGDYETNGYSLSAEYGKRFTKDNGFWIEPQVELTYGYVGAVDYLTSNDVSVRQNGMDSLVGRIGFSIGRDIKAGNVYARASYLYDFDGETDVSFSNGGVSRSFKQDLGGGWWEVGVGTNLSLSEATHLYFDVEKTYSGNVATPWQWNAGVRWSF